MPEPKDWAPQLRKQLQESLKFLRSRLKEEEAWLDSREDELDEAAHEQAVRKLDQWESVQECLEEALEILDEA